MRWAAIEQCSLAAARLPPPPAHPPLARLPPARLTLPPSPPSLPAQQDKILQSLSGQRLVTVTNDGATILKSLYVDNPAAKVRGCVACSVCAARGM